MVTVSAPGKIHVMGEHAVVYGKPALLTAINLRLSVSVDDSSTNNHEITIEDPEAKEFIAFAITKILERYKKAKEKPMKISIESQMPFGYHLGSSAAIAVATTGAVSYFLTQLWNPVEINQCAYEIEKKQHGNPSGGDNTAVTFGGFVWYRKELEFLKSMWQLPFKPAANLSNFFLINTGKPSETTGEMVAQVAAFAKEYPEEMQKLLDENEKQTRRIATCLKEGDEISLIDSIKKGEKTLEGMGVVSDKVKDFIAEIEKVDGAAKILGGGGKKESVGFVLCYHKNSKELDSLISSYGYTVQYITVGEEGIRLERKV